MIKIRLPKVIESAIFSAMGYDAFLDRKDEETETTIEELGTVFDGITTKTLREVEDDWVKSYIIN